MAKSKWGTKRLCQGCGVRFYDLLKNPAVCPACDTEVVIQVPRSRRAAAPAKAVEKVVKKVTVSDDKDDKDDKDDETGKFDSVVLDIDEDDDDDDDDEDSLIEDTSDLSADSGMDEVKEHMSKDTTDDN